jgi:hypothetical protein
MQPVKFNHANATFAKNQKGFLPLPAYTDGVLVISCWSMSWRERFVALFHGRLWIRQLTHGAPLQGIRPQVYDPFPKMKIVDQS